MRRAVLKQKGNLENLNLHRIINDTIALHKLGSKLHRCQPDWTWHQLQAKQALVLVTETSPTISRSPAVVERSPTVMPKSGVNESSRCRSERKCRYRFLPRHHGHSATGPLCLRFQLSHPELRSAQVGGKKRNTNPRPWILTNIHSTAGMTVTDIPVERKFEYFGWPTADVRSR